LKFLIEYISSTYNFKIWNEYCNESSLGIADFVENIEKEATSSMTIYQENGQKYVGTLSSKLKNDPYGALYFD
jgi:hypothetical protein